MPVVAFAPSGRSVTVEAGSRLMDACRQAGVTLPSPCGEKGLCGKCRVRLIKGDIPADTRQKNCLPGTLLADGWRAACVADIHGDVILADPVEEAPGGILTDFMTREPRGDSGVWEERLNLAKPSASDQTDDLARLTDALAAAGAANLRVDIPLLADLPDSLRRGAYRCRVFGHRRRVVAVTSDAEEYGRKLGLAVDIGTTTLAAALCDLDGGSVLALAARANPQANRGDDVISRIDYASRGRTELASLQLSLVRALEEMAAETAASAGVKATPILMVVAGNTVMTHLFAGVNPAALAQSPFVPAFRGQLTFFADRIGWRGPQPPLVSTIPNVAAYVGGDITAGLLAHDIARLPGTTLFLDVGTNGEIAIAVDGRLYACATAAGPAFEGARIRQGMRAIPGAISRVAVDPSGQCLAVSLVDSAGPAKGICGTGLIDAAAALLECGLLDETGRLLDREEAVKAGIAPGLADLMHVDDGPAVWLEKSAGTHHGVSLTQRDIRELQLAKGAVAAGVRVLLQAAGVEAGAVDRVLLAGGFGNYLDPASAVAIGLLPAGIATDRVRSVGNASLAGARLCLLSDREKEEAASLAAAVTYIELSGRDDFQIAFAEEMLFPEAGP